MNNQIRMVGLIFVGMLLIFGLGTVPSQAASFSVADEASLVAAINSANANADFDIIELTADINLPTATTYTFNGATGLPIITKPLLIRGNGHTIRRTSATQFRLLAANATQLWLEDLTLAGGNIAGSGGAVYVSGTGASLTLIAVIIGGSESNANQAIGGGGIYVGGKLSLIDSIVSYNRISGNTYALDLEGGGIYASGGTISIVNSTISYNEIFHGASAGSYSRGAGIAIDGGDIRILSTSISNNEINAGFAYGVGLYATQTNSLLVSDSDFIGNYNINNNTPYQVGGAGAYINSAVQTSSLIYASRFIGNSIIGQYAESGGIRGVNISIYDSTFADNLVTNPLTGGSAMGGGLALYNSQIYNSSIINNQTISYSENSGNSGAAGIHLLGGRVENSTISGNRTTHNGSYSGRAASGIYGESGTSYIYNNTIVGNNVVNPVTVNDAAGIEFGSSSTAYLANNIISGNTLTVTNGSSTIKNCSGSAFISQGYNAVENDSMNCGNRFQATGDTIGTVSLAPLADNGGLTFTHAISTTPPINSAGNLCPVTDQRGAARVGQCDIGAYEANATLPPANQAPNAGNDLYTTTANTSLTALITGNDSDPENQMLSYHLLSLPNNGSASVDINGSFTYSPMTNYSGNDSFSYQVCDVYGECSSATVTVVVNAVTSIPGTPSLSLDSVDSFLVNLAIIDNSNDETGFVIERRANGAAWTTVGNAAMNSTTYTDNSTFCAYPYDYRVRAYRASDGAYSLASNIISATTSACPPPPNFAGIATGYESTQLTWDDNLQDETRFRLERSTDDGTTWTLLSNLNPNSETYSNTGLFCGTSYQYRIRSERTSPAMVSAYSPAITISTNACPPLPIAPTNLTGNGTSYTSIYLEWADNSTDETGFQIYRSVDGGTTFSLVTTTVANRNYYNNSGSSLSCGTSYQYKVRATRTNPVQYSEYSNILTVSTTACPPPPLAQTNLALTGATYTSISLSWTDNNSDETFNYIEYSTNGGTTWLVGPNLPSSSSYNITGLTCGTVYHFRMRAYRSSPQQLYSEYSAVASGSTSACPPLPNVPTNLAAVSGGYTSINLSWTDTNSDELNYLLERSSNGGTSWSQVASLIANTTSYSNTGLSCNSSYQYRLRTYRLNPVPQYSPYSDVASATTDACPPLPDAPTALTATASSTSSIELSWADNSSTEVGFIIERSPNGTSSWTSLTTTAANTTTYISNSLSCNTIYYYRVKATNITGVSAYSNIANATTLGCPPSAPSSLSGTATGKTTISLTWFDNASNETAYYLERSVDAGLTWTVLDPLAANSTSFGDTGLLCSTNYRYRLRAYRSDVNAYSSYSATVSVTTQACTARPTAPTSIVLSPMTSNRLDIRWTDNATTETSYRLERSSDSGTTWVALAEIAANSTSYSDTTLTCNQDYRYRVAAFNAAEPSQSTWLTSSNSRTICAPTGLQTVLSSYGSIGLVWANPSSTRTFIERSSDNGVSWTQIADLNFGLNNAYTDTGLLCGTTYQYRMRFYDASGYSPYSSILNASTQDCYGITEATCTLNQIDLSSHIGNTVGPVYMSANGNRLLITYQTTSIVAAGMYLYDIPSESIVQNFPDAVYADIDADGSRITFVSSGNPLGQNPDLREEIFLWDETTGLSQLTNLNLDNGVGQPQISDDGTKVVFSGDGDVVGDATAGYFLYSWNATNGISKLIPQAGTGEDVALSGDGSTVVFTHGAALSGQSGLGSTQLYRWSATEGVQLLFPIPNPDSYTGFLFPPSVNTDGSRIVFVDNNNPIGLNPDGGNDIFLWDEVTGLSQVTEAYGNAIYFTAMDGSGNRILFYDGIDYDTDSTASSAIGHYLFDKDYGYSQINSVPVGDFPTMGSALSADGLRLALTMAVAWNGVSDVYPLVEIFIADCTPANHLPAPTSLVVTASAADSIDLAWTDNALGETGYRIERSADAGATWEEIAQAPANSNTYSDIDFACNLEYQYRLRAYRGGDNHFSDYSNVDTAPETADCLPAKPTALTVSEITETAISLAWTDNASDESEYRLERSTDNGTTWTEIAQPAADSTTYADTSILCNLDYKYRLRAYRAGDDVYSLYSNVVNAASLDCPPPLAPTLLAVTGTTETTVSLTWTDNASDETAYRLERSSDAGATWAEIASPAADSSGYVDATVFCASSYDYRLRAYRAGDSLYSDYSNLATGLTSLCSPSAAPTSLTMSSNSATSISLAWTDNAFNESQYRLERSSDAGATWTEIAQLAANSTTYSDTALTCGTSYDYRVRAYRTGDTIYSDYSNVLNTATLLCPPLAPSALTISANMLDSISLAWIDNASDETSYRIERSSDAGATWAELGTIAADSSSFVNSGLTCSSNYAYRVRAYRNADAQYSAYSNVVNGSTILCPPPNAPSVLNTTGSTQTSINLAWTDNASDESGYRLERSSDAGSTWTEIAQPAANATTYSNTALTCGTNYDYRLRAYRAGDSQYSAYSNVLTASTSLCPAPTAPTSLTSNTITATSLNLAWTDNASNETGYRLERSADAGATWTEIAQPAANSTSYSDTSLLCNTNYRYRVRAYRAGDNQYSSYSSSHSVTTSICPLLAPSNLATSATGQTSISLIWTDNSSNETNYRVERSSNAGVSWTEIAQPAASATTYSSIGLTCNTSYQYRVRAYRSGDAQYSAYSNVLTASTSLCPAPSTPTSLASPSKTASSVNLTWTDNASNETGYRVERSADAGVTWTEIAQLAANSTSHSDTGLTCATSYRYRVRAYRSGDDQYSAYSSTLTVSTSICPPPSAPSLLASTTVTSVSISLAWTDNASDETGYRLERSINAGTSWLEIAQLAPNSSNYSDSALTCGTAYQYRVRAYRSGDAQYSAYSNILSLSTSPCPLAPSGLASTGQTTSSITLAWTDNATDESEYRLERSANAGTSWTEIAQLPADSTNYTDAGLLCFTNYQYRVRAYRSSDGQYSSYSSNHSVTTLSCPILAAPTEAIVTDRQATSVSFAWTDNASGETSYRIERLNNGGSQYIQIAEIAANSTSYTDSSIICSSTVSYRIRAYQAGGNNNTSSFAQITTSTLDCPGMAGPVNTTSALTSYTVTYNWIDNASSETAYYLEKRISSAWVLIATLPANSTTYTDTVACNTANLYRLRAYDSVSGNYSVYANQNIISAYCPPSDLQASNITGTSLTLSWTNNSGSVPYNLVQRSITGQNTWTQIARQAGTSSTPSGSLLCNTTYDFRVAAEYFDSSRRSDFATLTVSTAACSAPTAPSGLTSTAISQTSISLAWTDNASNETAYRLERSDDAGATWTEIAQPAANASSYSDTTLTCNTSYQYRVRAYRAGDSQYSVYSNVLTTSTSACPPLAPTNLVLTSRTSDSITISWTDNATDENYYNVERSVNDGLSWTMWSLSPNNTTYTHSSLTCNKSYQYRVRVYRVSDTSYSSYSNTLIVSTLACPSAAPSNLTTSNILAGSITLNWLDNASDETGYRLERSADGISWSEVAQITANSTSYTDTNLTCNTTYDYRVRAYRSSDDQFSAYSNVATGTSSACPPPTAPTGLVVTGTGYTNIELAWTDNASDETGYHLERSADSGTTWSEIATPAANSSNYNDTSALCNTSYSYRVRVYRAGDSQYSSYSNEVTATTDICITLNAPTNLQLTGSTETSLSLSWTDNSTNESGYELERSLDGATWTLLSSLAADSSSYTDSALTCSSNYYYRLRSNHLGTGAYSPYGTSGVLTTAACPALVASVLSSTGTTQNSISLSWTFDTNGTSFTLAYYNGSAWVNLGIFPSSTTTYTQNGLLCGTSYQYQVTTFRTTDSASVTSGAFSTSTAVCPPLTAPLAPIVVNTEPALVSLQIPAMPSTATSMSLERSTDGSTWTNLGAVTSNYLDTNVVCGTSYQYRLVAVRSSDSATSSSSSALALTDACPIPMVVGVYRNGLWVFVESNNTTIPTNSFNFGDNTWQAFVGDWDGDGVDGVGIYRNGEFVLRNLATADAPENRFNFGAAEAGWQAIVGDWNGDGLDSIGLYKDGVFMLSDDNSNVQYRFNLGNGQADWQALAGDWDGNGADGIGLYKEGLWLLANDLNNPDGSSQSLNYGPSQSGWLAIVGDWNGDGFDSIGLYNNGLWRMRVNSINDSTETTLSFGQTGDAPLAIYESD